MARAFQATGNQKYLDAAIAGASHVQAMAVPVGVNGHLVPHILNDGRPARFYLGMCHGPVGTARLYYLLEQITGEKGWMDWSRGLDRGLINLGAPEERGRGFWNNISQCCCDAGIGDHALFMHRATDDPSYIDLAERVAAELIKRASKKTTQSAGHRRNIEASQILSDPDRLHARCRWCGEFLCSSGDTRCRKAVQDTFP